MATTILKRCNHCGVEKHLDQFVRRSDTQDGRRAKCRQCFNADALSRREARDAVTQESWKAYHAQKSREWYQRTKANAPERLAERSRYCASRRIAKKADWVQRFGGICAHCKQTHLDCVFEFHHVIGSEKDHDPSKLFGRSDEVIAAEMAKCIMLCANCHRIEHDRLKYADHSKRKLTGMPEPKKRAGQRHFYGWRYILGNEVFYSQQEASTKLGVSPARISQLVSAPGSPWVRERCFKPVTQHVARDYAKDPQ